MTELITPREFMNMSKRSSASDDDLIKSFNSSAKYAISQGRYVFRIYKSRPALSSNTDLRLGEARRLKHLLLKGGWGAKIGSIGDGTYFVTANPYQNFFDRVRWWSSQRRYADE